MRLISARIRDYRLHRDRSVVFDRRFTVIAGPNQSGKSTLAEALHRALFLPVKTGGELLKGMQSDPFMAEPEVELAFEAAGQRWELRKRFAGIRGSVSLRDGGGRSLQGDEAEEQLAQLIGTAAVPRNRGAADQLKERWGHLWVWQGSASQNPLALGAGGYDHDRLVERIQAGADLGIQSPLDLALIDSIQERYAAVYTAGGANRAPQVKRGSGLQLARAASEASQEAMESIKGRLHQQAEAEQAHQAAVETLTRLARELPELQQQRRDLEVRMSRSRELEAGIAREEPLLAAAGKEHSELNRDHKQLEEQSRRLSALEAAKAPDSQTLDELRRQLPELETAQQQSLLQLDGLQKTTSEAEAAVSAMEGRQNRLRQRRQQNLLQLQLVELERTATRRAELEQGLELLPPLSAADVETLRNLQAALREAKVRAEALATGLEVIRAGQPVRLDGTDLGEGATRLLASPALLQVGDDVELRLLPGGGGSAAEATAGVASAEQALATSLGRWKLATVEAAATAERRRSDLQAELERLNEEAGSADADRVREQIKVSDAALGAGQDDPADAALAPEQLEGRLSEVDQALQSVRLAKDAVSNTEREQRRRLQGCSEVLEAHRSAITKAEAALRDRDNQVLQARTLVQSVLERRGSLEVLQAALAEAEQRRATSQRTLDGLRSELNALGAGALKTEAQQLDQAISTLGQHEREADEARIRAESRLHGDGQVDLQAELEQKQAELESRLMEQERLEKEAGMLQLMRGLLEEEQNAMGSAYTTPLIDRIGRYLAEVFPEAPQPSLSYDARGGGFQALQWRRGNEAIFGFDVLSIGAREQFAAALRVAMADVLAEAYDGSLPVLFDDAFANSDPERQAGVYRMLQQAANQGLQVILLTCDPERSQGIVDSSLINLGR